MLTGKKIDSVNEIASSVVLSKSCSRVNIIVIFTWTLKKIVHLHCHCTDDYTYHHRFVVGACTQTLIFFFLIQSTFIPFVINIFHGELQVQVSVHIHFPLSLRHPYKLTNKANTWRLEVREKEKKVFWVQYPFLLFVPSCKADRRRRSDQKVR